MLCRHSYDVFAGGSGVLGEAAEAADAGFIGLEFEGGAELAGTGVFHDHGSPSVGGLAYGQVEAVWPQLVGVQTEQSRNKFFFAEFPCGVAQRDAAQFVPNSAEADVVERFSHLGDYETPRPSAPAEEQITSLLSPLFLP